MDRVRVPDLSTAGLEWITAPPRRVDVLLCAVVRLDERTQAGLIVVINSKLRASL